MLTISKSHLPVVIECVKSYMHSSMYYKLGLKADKMESFNNKSRALALLALPELNKFSSDCYNYRDNI